MNLLYRAIRLSTATHLVVRRNSFEKSPLAFSDGIPTLPAWHQRHLFRPLLHTFRLRRTLVPEATAFLPVQLESAEQFSITTNFCSSSLQTRAYQ